MQSHALDPVLVAKVADWLASRVPGVAWLTGTSGSGMTRMVTGLTQGMEGVWMTGANLKSRAFLRDTCSNPVAVNLRRKVIVLDELDVVLGNEAAMAEVVFLFKHNTTLPIVCVLKSTRSALACELIKKAALVVHFPPPTRDAMMAVVAEEGLACARAEEVCGAAAGDIRHVLQTLRAQSVKVRHVTPPTADAVQILFERVSTVRESLGLYGADAGAVAGGVFETYWQTTQDVCLLAQYMDMASLGDVVDEHIHARHRWDLMELHGALTTSSAAIVLPKSRGVCLTRYGTLWNKYYLLCTKIKTARRLNLVRVARGMCRLPPTDLAFVRHMLCGASIPLMVEVCTKAGLDALGCLHLMRLWGTGYKLSTHSRLKKALGP